MSKPVNDGEGCLMLIAGLVTLYAFAIGVECVKWIFGTLSDINIDYYIATGVGLTVVGIPAIVYYQRQQAEAEKQRQTEQAEARKQQLQARADALLRAAQLAATEKERRCATSH